MSTQPSTTVSVPVLHCMYSDCGNDWFPRTDRMPKVCPKCKRYGWQTGVKQKRKGKGGKHVNMGKATHLGPQTEKFIRLHKTETEERSK